MTKSKPNNIKAVWTCIRVYSCQSHTLVDTLELRGFMFVNLTTSSRTQPPILEHSSSNPKLNLTK